jgi:excisionase family DNA binding protein
MPTRIGFDDIARDPAKAAALSADAARALFVQCVVVQGALAPLLVAASGAPATSAPAAAAKYLTPDDVAKRLQLNRPAVYELIHSQKLKAVKLGKYYRIAPDALQALLDESSSETLHSRHDSRRATEAPPESWFDPVRVRPCRGRASGHLQEVGSRDAGHPPDDGASDQAPRGRAKA